LRNYNDDGRWDGGLGKIRTRRVRWKKGAVEARDGQSVPMPVLEAGDGDS